MDLTWNIDMECSNLDPEDIHLTTWHHANYPTDLLSIYLFDAKTLYVIGFIGNFEWYKDLVINFHYNM